MEERGRRKGREGMQRNRQIEKGGKGMDAAKHAKSLRAEKQTDTTHRHTERGILDRRIPQITQDDPPLAYPGLRLSETFGCVVRVWRDKGVCFFTTVMEGGGRYDPPRPSLRLICSRPRGTALTRWKRERDPEKERARKGGNRKGCSETDRKPRARRGMEKEGRV